MPSFIGNIKKSTYITNKEGEKGKLVSPEFTYSSDKNNFLSVKEIKKNLII